MRVMVDIPASEFSEAFVNGMKDRMHVSYYKYGPVVEAYPDKVDAIASAILRLREYIKTGNTEFLMDAANFAMIEFMHPRREDSFFKPTDDDASPGRISLKTGRPDKRANKDL
jgi:hypothetical protein